MKQHGISDGRYVHLDGRFVQLGIFPQQSCRRLGVKIKRVDLRKIHPGMEIKVTVVWVGGTLSDSHEKPVATTLDCERVETIEPECKCTFCLSPRQDR